jgi:L-alanine-DL-glutamate epimerase-like enolase superfamily enzyme
MVDCNQTFTTDEAIRRALLSERFNLAWIGELFPRLMSKVMSASAVTHQCRGRGGVALLGLMELHVSLACAAPNGRWVAYISLLSRLCSKDPEVVDGRILLPQTAGIGIDWKLDRYQRTLQGRLRTKTIRKYNF